MVPWECFNEQSRCAKSSDKASNQAFKCSNLNSDSSYSTFINDTLLVTNDKNLSDYHYINVPDECIDLIVSMKTAAMQNPIIAHRPIDTSFDTARQHKSKLPIFTDHNFDQEAGHTMKLKRSTKNYDIDTKDARDKSTQEFQRYCESGNLTSPFSIQKQVNKFIELLLAKNQFYIGDIRREINSYIFVELMDRSKQDVTKFKKYAFRSNGMNAEHMVNSQTSVLRED